MMRRKGWVALVLVLGGLYSARELSAADESVFRGQVLYQSWCLPCHDAGPGHPGTMALAVRVGEERSVLLERTDLTKDYVGVIARNGLQMMPPFRPTELSDADIEAIWAYMASARDRRKDLGVKSSQ